MTTLIRRRNIGEQGSTVAAATNGARPKPEAAVRDIRYLALRNFAISLSALNIVGYTLLGFEQPPLWPILAILAAYAIDLVFETLTAWSRDTSPRYLGRGARGVYEFLLPAHITALAVNMLLYANNQFWPILFAVAAAITSKYVFQAPFGGRMRHFMNPSNFGITLALLCFSTWISVAPPYEFGENINTMFRIAVPFILAIAGTLINATLVRRIPLIVGWLGGFVIQAIVRHELFDVALFAALGTMTGTAFILFTNYMITDPGTTPFPAKAQFMFGASAATVYGLLMVFNVVYTLFFAVTIVCAIRGTYAWIAHWVRAARKSRLRAEPAPELVHAAVQRV
ncbi:MULTISPECIES: RnfABCDGE type electron transport complex subunit D [unclassified Nocardia]|uniref:RnfABCDGE type electron transport complex subunit D n=1 Tax=unclassified Nocardia TaxID=2637762 RepID=UPI001CE496D4|nr:MULTISPECIES: RnfABCDGE type electron transport complex subunit D [unclassified Nocardia]